MVRAIPPATCHAVSGYDELSVTSSLNSHEEVGRGAFERIEVCHGCQHQIADLSTCDSDSKGKDMSILVTYKLPRRGSAANARGAILEMLLLLSNLWTNA